MRRFRRDDFEESVQPRFGFIIFFSCKSQARSREFRRMVTVAMREWLLYTRSHLGMSQYFVSTRSQFCDLAESWSNTGFH